MRMYIAGWLLAASTLVIPQGAFAQQAPEAKRPPSTVFPMERAEAERNLRKRVEPAYPDAARDRHVQGTVKLAVIIGPDGKLLDVRAVRGPAMLRDAATSAVRQWVYAPFVVRGRAIPVVTEVDVPFRLR